MNRVSSHTLIGDAISVGVPFLGYLSAIDKEIVIDHRSCEPDIAELGQSRYIIISARNGQCTSPSSRPMKRFYFGDFELCNGPYDAETQDKEQAAPAWAHHLINFLLKVW